MQQTHNHDGEFNPLDDYILARIQFRVDKLIGQYGFTDDDAEDLKHELIVAVLESVPGFDPEKAIWRTYVRHVLERTVIDITRRRQVHRHYFAPSGGSSFENMVGKEGQRCGAEQRRRGGTELSVPEQVALADAVEHALRDLPERTKRVAEMLKTHTPSEIALRLGVSTSTIYREMETVRQAFESCRLDEI